MTLHRLFPLLFTTIVVSLSMLCTLMAYIVNNIKQSDQGSCCACHCFCHKISLEYILIYAADVKADNIFWTKYISRIRFKNHPDPFLTQTQQWSDFNLGFQNNSQFTEGGKLK